MAQLPLKLDQLSYCQQIIGIKEVTCSPLQYVNYITDVMGQKQFIFLHLQYHNRI